MLEIQIKPSISRLIINEQINKYFQMKSNDFQKVKTEGEWERQRERKQD